MATPEEKHQMLSCMFESLYVQFRTGQIIEVVPKPGFRWVFEAAEIAKPPSHVPGDPLLVIGDPEGIRSPSQLQKHCPISRDTPPIWRRWVPTGF